MSNDWGWKAERKAGHLSDRAISLVGVRRMFGQRVDETLRGIGTGWRVSEYVALIHVVRLYRLYLRLYRYETVILCLRSDPREGVCDPANTHWSHPVVARYQTASWLAEMSSSYVTLETSQPEWVGLKPLPRNLRWNSTHNERV